MRSPRHALLASLLLLMACRPATAADDWTFVSRDHGIETYRRTVPGSSIVALKGHGVIDAPVWKVASVLLDTKRAPEWVDSLKESRVVRRRSVNAYVEYNHLGLPLIIKDREFVSEVHIDVNPETHEVALVYRPIDDGSVPAGHAVRGEIVSGAFRAVSRDGGRQTELTAELHCDPKGAIPAWVVNLFQRNWPHATFEGLRRQVAKPDVVMPPEFVDVLTPARAFE